MEEDPATADQSSTNDHNPNPEEESNEMKDFVYKHLQVVTEQSNGSLQRKPDEYSIEETSAPTHKNRKMIKKSYTQGAVFAGNILSFSCSVCKDDFTFSPNDLLKHFKESHKDGVPSYPCDLCGFVTNEFPDLQRHRIGHRNTLVTCEICNDDYQYSLLMLTRHFVNCHSSSGRFQCEKCDFKTLDAGTFVQHIHHHKDHRFKCFKCPHVSLNKDEYQRHNMVHMSKLSFNCQICGYVAERIEYFKKHMINAHEEETGDWLNVQRAEEDDDEANSNSPATLKLLLKEDTKGPRRVSKRKCVSGNLQNNIGLNKSEKAVKKNKNGSKTPTTEQKTACELIPPIQLMKLDHGNSSEKTHNTSGMTVLKLKNKITIPPNCTTKVIGFKLVDGKKHLVLKVLPVSKVESASQDHSQTKDLVGNIRKCNSDGLTNSHLTASQNINAHVFQDDIVAVKVKVEEEEIPLSGFFSAVQKDECKEEEEEIKQNCSPKCFAQSSTLYSVENKMDHVKEKTNVDLNSNHDPLSKLKIHNVLSLLSSIHVDLSQDKNERLLDTATNSLVTEWSKNNPDMSIGRTNTPSESAMPLHSSSTSYSKEPTTLSEISLMNTPNEEVFSFHNYSKESLSSSPHSTKPFDHQTETMHADAPPQWCLQLAESPRPSSKCGQGSNVSNQPPHQEYIETTPEHCDSYADEQMTDEIPESMFQDFNIIKVEEDHIPVSKSKQESNSLGHPGHEKSILAMKQHSDAIINHQLNKERVGTCPDSGEPGKTGKATLRIFQNPDGKQQMLLQTAENKYAIPVQLNRNASFKLITKSSSPRINVSYLKPGFEFSSTSTVLASQSGREVGMAKPFLRPSKTGIPSVSAVQPNNTISNHYHLNSTGLNGPVLVSKTGQGAPVDKTGLKSQQTCYLVQRSPLGSHPGLAMPLNPAEKSNILPTGHQTYLVRYVSQAKSGNIFSNLEGQTVTREKQNSESAGPKVLYRIVTPTSGIFASIVPTATDEPLFFAPRSQSDQSFLMSEKTNDLTFTGVRNIFPLNRAAPAGDMLSGIFQSQSNVKVIENPWPIRPPSQRKRRRKPLFDELPMHKTKRLANKMPTTEVWHPVTKDIERTLRLCPFSSLQQVKCPRVHQPVVVLNHPDADIPEVANIMKSVNRYRGAVTKVKLSHQTLSALDQMGLPGKNPFTKGLLPASNCSRLQPDQSSVRERFLLKLKLKKKGRKKYEIVKTLSSHAEQPIFYCWFCGRLFNSQEEWIGHGQRHLMEATRDWNKLF